MLERLSIEDCDELEHIVVDIGDGSDARINIVFPKLKELIIIHCKKLKYIFGHINASDHHHEYHLYLPALKYLKLFYLPSLIGMGTKNYVTMLSHLVKLQLVACDRLAVIKSIGDFVYPMSKFQDSTTIEVHLFPYTISEINICQRSTPILSQLFRHIQFVFVLMFEVVRILFL
jgi:hypothetical protein